MYYPILKAKRHELNSLYDLSSRLNAAKYRPVIEPVNRSFVEVFDAVEELHKHSVQPLVVINPSQGFFSSATSANVFSQLQSNTKSANRFTPCIKVRDSSDSISLSLLSMYPGAAVYLENDALMSSVALLNTASLVILNQQKVDSDVVDKLSKVVLYADNFAKKKRNADYGASSFYSNLHVSYKKRKNAVGFGDFTIMAEEYSESGGPAYVVAIHASHIDALLPNSIQVRHFLSTTGGTLPTNPGGKYLEALDKLINFDAINPGFFDSTLGMGEFKASHAVGHYPGLGIVKEMSIKHHIESVCNFI
ncbi:sce7725 family protein [Pseudomonas sp. BR20]|uniref:sce7725 family protein n=1 Tax=Pseudomonas sp. BR20 TaxID=3137452 RepID=UPI003D6E240F